jgi:hypothetical protein
VTRLVVHAGAEFADSGAVLRDLVAHRDGLVESGVLLPPEDEATSWRETAQGLLRGDPSATALIARARETGVGAVLFSSDILADALASPDQAAVLAEMGAAERLDVRVVVVVREQIGYINSLYCQRVLNLDTVRSLAEFAAMAVPAHRFDYVASFGAIADTAGLELVAIPYPDLRAKGAGRAVLEAAGLGSATPDTMRMSEAAFEPVPGPVLVGATRLLHKRLRRLNSFHEQGRPRLRVLAEQLAARAGEAGWDTTQFWGWDAAVRRAVEDEYRDSNAVFADFVWGTPWPEPWSGGRPQRVDLADLDPPVLREVLTTVDELVDSATQRASSD